MKKNILITITTIIVLSLFCAQIVVSNRLATMGADLSQMDVATTEFQKENESLSHKIASESSLMVVAKQAEELGFSQATVRYVERPPVAFRHE